MGTVAGGAVAEQQPPLGGRVPVGPCEGVGLGDVEPIGPGATPYRPAHWNSPIASSSDHVCHDIPNSPTTEISAIIEFCPCSAQSWIMRTR